MDKVWQIFQIHMFATALQVQKAQPIANKLATRQQIDKVISNTYFFYLVSLISILVFKNYANLKKQITLPTSTQLVSATSQQTENTLAMYLKQCIHFLF